MKSLTAYWSGTSGDKLYISYTGVGDGEIRITSDDNYGDTRSKDIHVTSSDGSVRKTITVVQKANSELYSSKSLGTV